MEKVLERISENLSIEVMPDDKFGFLMTTNDVAKGFGVADSSIRSHKLEHPEELIEGKHFITSLGRTNAFGLQTITTLWTKVGIIRLCSFIRSERSKLFRDWAEDLMINEIDKAYHGANKNIGAEYLN